MKLIYISILKKTMNYGQPRPKVSKSDGNECPIIGHLWCGDPSEGFSDSNKSGSNLK